MADVGSVAAISTEASGEAFPWSGVELFDNSVRLVRGTWRRNASQVPNIF